MASSGAASSAVTLDPPGGALPLSPYEPFDPVAVTRGLLLDLLATGDTEAADQAMEAPSSP